MNRLTKPLAPPHAHDAEQALIGGLLIDNNRWHDIEAKVSASDFYTADHQIIFQGISELLSRGMPCDYLTLTEHLRRQGKLEAAGGPASIAVLASDAAGASNVGVYARIVQECATLRAMLRVSFDISEMAYHPEGRDLETLIETAEQRVYSVRQRMGRRAGDVQPIASYLDAVELNIQNARDNPEAVTGLSTGFTDLDRMTTGLYPGDLIIVGGRPAMGKTSFAMNIAEHVSVERDLPTLVFTMEMSGEQLSLRVLSSLTRINQQKLRTGDVNDFEMSRVLEKSGILREAPLMLDETGAISPFELAGRARRVHARTPLALIVVDYLQLMRIPDHRENRTNEISEISRSLKALAKELKVPVIALSQLSRSLETRENKRPVLSDLRESGGIEQDADVVLFVYRDEYYHPDKRESRGVAEIIIAKQRSGPTGVVKTAFLGSLTRFENLAPTFEDPFP